MVQEAPVSVVAVKVTQKGINYEHIPKMLQQYSRVNVTLLFNGIQNITQFRTGTAVFGVYDCILDGAEIEQSTSVRGEIFAGADDFTFSSDLEGPEDRLLRRNTYHVEYGAGNMLTDAAVGIREFRLLVLSRGRELQHIRFALIFYRNFLAVGSIIYPVI